MLSHHIFTDVFVHPICITVVGLCAILWYDNTPITQPYTWIKWHKIYYIVRTNARKVGRNYMCVRGIDLASVSTTVWFCFGTVPTMLYLFVIPLHKGIKYCWYKASNISKRAHGFILVFLIESLLLLLLIFCVVFLVSLSLFCILKLMLSFCCVSLRFVSGSQCCPESLHCSVLIAAHPVISNGYITQYL